MPSSYEALRKKFMTDTGDGIIKAETIMKEAGWSFEGGWMTPPKTEDFSKHTVGEIVDACDYLIDEWDYAVTPSATKAETVDEYFNKLRDAILSEAMSCVYHERIRENLVATVGDSAYNEGLMKAVVTIKRMKKEQ